MSGDNFALILGAIKKRQHVIATYNGHRRWLCPHTLGFKRNRAQCLFYQFDGSSESGLSYDGSPENWRCIPVESLRDVEVAEGPWHTAPNHSVRQTCVGRVVAEAW